MNSFWNELERARELLNSNDVVGLPTETVYGLAARIDREDALKKIFKVKSRPLFDPLIVHVASIAEAKELSKGWGPLHQELAEEFWPGPLTLVVDKHEQRVSDLITASLPTVGIRLPSHPFMRRLIRSTGTALAAPSANVFGRTSPSSAQDVRDEFSDQNVFVVDGGPCKLGIESTVLKISSEKNSIEILRPGFITEEMLEKHFAKRVQIIANKKGAKDAPGQLENHYQPRLPLLLVETEKLPADFDSKIVNWISLPEDPVDCARNLYSLLRHPENGDADYLAIRKPKRIASQGLWAAIWDRLEKASTQSIL